MIFVGPLRTNKELPTVISGIYGYFQLNKLNLFKRTQWNSNESDAEFKKNDLNGHDVVLFFAILTMFMSSLFRVTIMVKNLML